MGSGKSKKGATEGFPPDVLEGIERIVGEHDLRLVDLVRRGHTNSTVVEVIVDNIEGPTLEDLALVSRAIGALLDRDEISPVIPGRYRLEVTTPGLDRPLDEPWQFAKNVGRLLKVGYHDEAGKKRTELFRLLSVDGGSFELQPMKSPKKGPPKPSGDPITLTRERIEKATVEPEL